MAQRGPIPFPIEANVGQAAGQVAYLVRMGDLQVGFEAGGLSYALRATEPAETAEPGSRGRPGLKRPDQVHQWTVRQELVGAGHAEPVGTITAETAISYFVGPSDAGRVGVPAYHQVAYPGVWSGITAAYQRVGFGLKSSFHLAPGADPAQIRLAYHGGHTRLAEDGALEVETPLGLMRESAPVAWQEGRAGRKPVTVRWVLRDGPDGDAEEVGFQTGAYDPSRPLVIDPSLTYTTYVGGSGTDIGNSIAVDAGGSTYVTGRTLSSQATFPTGGGFVGTPGFDQTFNSNYDAFVVKLNPSRTGLVYATYLGGSSGEDGIGIAVDAGGSAYVTGYTTSTQATFPDGDVNGNDLMDVPGFDQTHNGDVDAFVVKLNPSGTALVYATYVGGSDLDVGNAIAITAGGNAYVTGYTRSSEATFPDGDPNGNDLMDVPGFDQNHNGGAGLDDLFVAKLTESTSTPTQTPTNTSTLTSTPTSTTSPTSTSTPTSTPTATPGLCAPRPKVNVTMSPGGAGLLNATLQAQVLPATPANALTSLRVTALTNVQVSRNGVILAAGPIIPLPPGTQQIVLVVQRLVPGQAATAQLVVTDACGEWPTFVGGGPNAF